MAKVRIIPNVVKYVDYGEKIRFKKLYCKENLTTYQKDLLKNYLDEKSKNLLIFKTDKKIIKQAYKIKVNQHQIIVYYNDEEGKLNAILTLVQMLKQEKQLTTCYIYDKPNFEVRSVMIDISRNKVPTLKTLKEIVDQLSLVKINDLQLYIEGRSFYFESYPEYYENADDFLTGKDVLELTKYAKERGVSLTPNGNCFGHMAYWLNQKELNHLAFMPEGFEWGENGLRGYAATIDPRKEGAQQLVYNLFDDLLKYYPDTKYFTIGGDEPFELLFPKKYEHTKELYGSHISDIVKYVNNKGIIPCMWGDVVKEYPELLEEIKDVVFLEWGYDAGHFNDKKCAFYKDHNKPFMVCCGTSGWLTFTGRMDNMMKNYQEAAHYGKKYNALGMMITDWNDGGSMSQLVTLMFCYIYGAVYAWNDNDVNRKEVNEYLNENIYHNNIANAVFELGRYNTCQSKVTPNCTALFNMYYCCQIDGINFDIGAYSDCASLFNRKDVLNYEDLGKTREFLNNWINEFSYQKENQYIKELIFIYKVIRHALNLNQAYLNINNLKCYKAEIKALLDDINYLSKEYKKIWHYRNKESDFKLSYHRMVMLKQKYTNLLKMMKI